MQAAKNAPRTSKSEKVLFELLSIRGQNIIFLVFMFAKPEFDNVLQPELRSRDGCNTLSHEGLANVNTEKNVISSLFNTCLKWQ